MYFIRGERFLRGPAQIRRLTAERPKALSTFWRRFDDQLSAKDILEKWDKQGAC